MESLYYTAIGLVCMLGLFCIVLRVSPAELWQVLVVDIYKTLTSKEANTTKTARVQPNTQGK